MSRNKIVFTPYKCMNKWRLDKNKSERKTKMNVYQN